MEDEGLKRYRMQGDRLQLFRGMMRSAVKLSFDSLIVNIKELHVTIGIETAERQSELFDFSLTDDVKYELEWSYFPTFRPRYKVADDVLSSFTCLLLKLLEDLCDKVETVYFGTCRFLNVSQICHTFLSKGTVKRLEVLEWSGFSAAIDDKGPIVKIFESLEYLEVAASDSRNTQRRQSVETLIELASSTGKLLSLKFVGADYTVQAFAPFLSANQQLQRLELHRFQVEKSSSWDETFFAIHELPDLERLVIRDVKVPGQLVIYMYRSILENNASLRKLTVVSLCGHPSFVTADQSLQLRQVFSSATSLAEVCFESSVIHAPEVNNASFLAGLLCGRALSSLQVSPCAIDVGSLVAALSRKNSTLRLLRLGSLHRDVPLQDLKLLTAALSQNCVLEHLTLAMTRLDPLSSSLFGSCIARQSSLRYVSVTVNFCSDDDNDDDEIQVCRALASGIGPNKSLTRFDLMCRYGFHCDEEELMVPFSHALEANKSIHQVNLMSTSCCDPCGRLQMDARGEILLGMNRLGREQFIDPSFQFCLWPKILAKISDPSTFFHTLQVSPNMVMYPSS
jgi:hypothetical protein